MNIVICVAFKDCFFLKKNLFFIRKNIHPEHIWIITNKNNFKFFSDEKSDLSCIDEDELIEGLTFDVVSKCLRQHMKVRCSYGWYYQQFLKLGFALSKYAEKEYLVWDADTIPLNPLVFKADENSDFFLPKTEHHQPYFDTMDRLLEVPEKASYSFIAEHMVFNVAIVREMLQKIEENAGNHLKWYELCILAISPVSPNGFSEFETYGTYCLNYYKAQLRPRFLRTFRNGGKIFGVFASQEEIESLSSELDTVSFELRDLPVSFYRRCKQWIFFKFCNGLKRIFFLA